MNGLEKIVGHITAEAEQKANAILSEAKQKAEAIQADTKAKADAECDRIQKKANAEAANKIARGEASAQLRKKQILLTGKQELINETIGKAADYLAGLPDADYFDFLKKLYSRHVPGKDAKLYLNERDLGRVPKELLASFQEAAKAKGASLCIGETPVQIRGGFILDFGGIEENCSVDALIDDNMELLQDKVYQVLFA